MTRRKLSLKEPVPQGTSVDTVVERVCANCRLYETEQGLCRKRSPYRDPATGDAVWPRVYKTDWCGDFKRLPVEPFAGWMS